MAELAELSGTPYLNADEQLSHETPATSGRRPLLDDVTAEEWARWFKVLADPTRLRVVALLAGHPLSLCAGEIARSLGISPPALSYHLRLLEQADLVVTRRYGHLVRCSLAEEALLQGLAALARLIPEQRRDARWRRRQWRTGRYMSRLRAALRSHGVR